MAATGRRTVLALSLSPANPDAVLVTQALLEQGVPKGRRSAAILGWAAAYLQGRALEKPMVIAELGMSEAEFDQLLDDF